MRLIALLILFASPVFAESWESVRDRKPELFDPETGFRVSRYRAPVPDDIPPPSVPIAAEEAMTALANGAVAIDVFGLRNSRFDELDGSWVVSERHDSIPGAYWLPEVGRGPVRPEIAAYLAASLARLTRGDRTHPLVVFCRADCWMSWNAARRIAALGYENVLWFPLGVEGWEEAGGALAPILPEPVPVN